MLAIRIRNGFILIILCLLTACVHLPSGPSVMVLPGQGKAFDQFRSDDYECKQYASEQIGGNTPWQASRISGVESAAVGTGLGAAAGAAIGGGQGAAIGAGLGLLMGGLFGSSTATTSGYTSQQRYDSGYIQCMYAKGHRVPVEGRIANDPSANRSAPARVSTPPADFVPPPPPPGNPPPPPPR